LKSSNYIFKGETLTHGCCDLDLVGDKTGSDMVFCDLSTILDSWSFEFKIAGNMYIESCFSVIKSLGFL